MSERTRCVGNVFGNVEKRSVSAVERGRGPCFGAVFQLRAEGFATVEERPFRAA